MPTLHWYERANFLGLIKQLNKIRGSRNNVGTIATCYRLDGSGFKPHYGKAFYVVHSCPESTVPTQPPVVSWLSPESKLAEMLS